MSLYLGENKVKLHSPTAIAYTVKGNPTITEDGVASGFTDKTDYLTLGAFNPGTSKWKFTTKVKIYDYATQISLIDRNSSTRCFQIVVRTTGKFRVNISTNGSSKANEVDGTHVVSINTIYYICFEYDGSKYYLKYSLDNINWVTDITINNSTKIYPVSSMCMGHSWYNSGTEKWNGEIYLRWTRFEINGVTNDKYKLHALEGDYAIVDDKLVWANPNIYLQSSGTQYINTGLNINLNDTIEMNISIQDPGAGYGNFYIFEAGSDGNNSRKGLSNYRFNTACQFYYNYMYSSYSTGYNILNNFNHKFYIKTILENSEYNYYFDEVLKKAVTASENIVSKNLYLFSTTGKSFKGYCKLYNFKVYDYLTNYLKYHFVPVPTGLQIGNFTVPSNGMFDIVNQQFYPNQGTGTFTYGKDE